MSTASPSRSSGPRSFRPRPTLWNSGRPAPPRWSASCARRRRQSTAPWWSSAWAACVQGPLPAASTWRRSGLSGLMALSPGPRRLAGRHLWAALDSCCRWAQHRAFQRLRRHRPRAWAESCPRTLRRGSRRHMSAASGLTHQCRLGPCRSCQATQPRPHARSHRRWRPPSRHRRRHRRRLSRRLQAQAAGRPRRGLDRRNRQGPSWGSSASRQPAQPPPLQPRRRLHPARPFPCRRCMLRRVHRPPLMQAAFPGVRPGPRHRRLWGRRR
mmetsp:Transcript_104701/g.327687  ORF Transcript_104701/g.327687 Transcript_104701/m.327687 type:complete len:269 (+) Transcript_104701:1552-2358(+)